MIFTLEALNAKLGDCLLMHYGEKKSLKHILIDGGPASIYHDTLKKRLAELRPASGHGAPRLEMIMLSRLDSDHLCGICAMAEDMIRAHSLHKPFPYEVSSLWLNTFEKKLQNRIRELSVSLEGAAAGTYEADFSYPVTYTLPIEPNTAAYLTSIKDGVKMINYAHKLGFSVNSPFEDYVLAPSYGEEIVEIDKKYGLKFSIIAPDQCMLDAIDEEWKKSCVKITNARAKNRMKEAEMFAAEYIDKWISQLSGIALLAEAGRKTMLLTGDIKGEVIIEGLKRALMLNSGRLHVDLLELPHHGSKRSVNPEFFQTITADHYLISGNGIDNNPDIETLEWLIKSRGSDRFTIYCTNCEKRLAYYFEKIKNRNFHVVFRKQSEPSVQIKLGE